jgi:hypothetical protein
VNKTPPTTTKVQRPLPGEEYESQKPLPPVENVVRELPPAASEPLDQEPAPASNEATPPRQESEPTTNAA